MVLLDEGSRVMMRGASVEVEGCFGLWMGMIGWLMDAA
jgi:hypothetical protein